ncbi:lysin A, protease C39 domain [Gordonia phage Horus]|uniref:Lysin A, protease C39 domain n=3 Tax=Caudoviricetes TaxID=2731619 RepID=A0A345L129_9CAUD|nr:endolysin [Gordonia phage Apricot]YP_009808260.1 endolysin [Gordonia phage Horus]YP_009808364.1 endolysin [Gordonia phage Phistory]QYC53689.1 lysin A, protease C39 domain [Gordonia phage Leroy]WNM69728.1 lysin A, protease C39 domain [Gordonia phage Crater]AXH48981.1 lysin A, protease C39 domain [Gordonia phage Apricot]AXQ63875.1 lysin A, protease C39 domain [Gordonia phage Horus]AXQ64728.1 lysin A, protease C39 domain [Gordonia phage Phistory]
MAEKKLAFNLGRISQETYYWCGPATCQNILSSRGQEVNENVLARELGTTTNGTNHIGLLRNVLEARLRAPYVSRLIQNDPPTKFQTDLFWADLVKSIDAGFGVAMNWIAPPNNYPRGVKGSQSPAYSGGMVYHYVAAMGYDDASRSVWIADSGFRPFSYWVSLDQCVSLIAGKGYAAYPKEPVSAPSYADDELSKKFPSRSKYRANDLPVDTLAGFILNIDGRIHERYTEAR